MSENQCLWCGQAYQQAMEGVCRECWEKHQFDDKIMSSPEYRKDMDRFDKLMEEKYKEVE